MSDAGLVLEGGGDWTKLEAATNRSFSQVLKQMNRLQGQADSLEKHLAAVGKTVKSGRVVSEINSIQAALEKIEPANAEKALAKIFDASRLAILEEGSAKVRLFGSALEPLGPIGLGVAAAIAAVGFAFEEAKKAAEWAEELTKAANAIGITTSALQEFDFVAEATGTPVDKMRDALKSLTGQVGQLQDNFARVKNGPQVKVWEAVLGTPGDAKAAETQLRQLGDLQHILPVLVEYAAKLSDTQRAGVAKALRIDPEVLNSWVEAKTGIGDLIEKAKSFGVVVDEEVVRKSAEAAQQMHIASTVIQDEFRAAFLDLAPAAADAATAIAHAAQNIAQLVRDTKDALVPIGQLIDDLKRIPGLKLAAQTITTDPNSPVASILNPFGTGMARIGDVIHQMGEAGRAQQSKAAIENMLAGGKYDGPPREEADQKPAHALVPDDAKKGNHHSTAEHNASAEWDALRAYDEALIKAAKSLEEEHQARLKLIADTRDAAKYRATKDKSLTKPTRDMVLDTAGKTFDADTLAENARYQKAAAAHARSVGDQMSKYLEDQLRAEADIAGTLSARQTAERQRLLDEQAQARADLDEKIKTDRAYSTPQGQLEAYRLRIAQLAAQQAERAAQQAGDDKATGEEAGKVNLRTLGFEEQAARAAESIARTASQRRAAAEHLLQVQQKIAQENLDQQAKDGKWTVAQKAEGQAALNADYASQRADLAVRYASPLQQFSREQTGDLGEQLESNAVTAMREINAGLAEAIANGKSLHDVLRKALRQSAGNLIQQGLGRAEGSALNLFGLGGQQSLTTPGAAAAGAKTNPLGTIMSVGSTMLKIFGFAEGGKVPGSGRGDKIPALLEPGERITRNGPSQRYAPLLDAINSGHDIAHFANGGVVGRATSLPRLRFGGSGSNTLNVTHNVHLEGTSGDRAIDEKIALATRLSAVRTFDEVQRAMPGMMAQHQLEAG